jgi:hypothetical protein
MARKHDPAEHAEEERCQTLRRRQQLQPVILTTMCGSMPKPSLSRNSEGLVAFTRVSIGIADGVRRCTSSEWLPDAPMRRCLSRCRSAPRMLSPTATRPRPGVFQVENIEHPLCGRWTIHCASRFLRLVSSSTRFSTLAVEKVAIGTARKVSRSGCHVRVARRLVWGAVSFPSCLPSGCLCTRPATADMTADVDRANPPGTASSSSGLSALLLSRRRHPLAGKA